MGLCIVKGETVTVTVEGANEDTTVVEMEKFFKENLQEVLLWKPRSERKYLTVLQQGNTVL